MVICCFSIERRICSWSYSKRAVQDLFNTSLVTIHRQASIFFCVHNSLRLPTKRKTFISCTSSLSVTTLCTCTLCSPGWYNRYCGILNQIVDVFLMFHSCSYVHILQGMQPVRLSYVHWLISKLTVYAASPPTPPPLQSLPPSAWTVS